MNFQGHNSIFEKAISHRGLIRIISFILLVLIALYLVKAKSDVTKLEQELIETQAKIARQELQNNEVRILLSDEEESLERSAREDMDYADPEEQVFIIGP